MLLGFFSNKNSKALITELLIYGGWSLLSMGVGPFLVGDPELIKPSFVTITGKKRENLHDIHN